MKAKPFVIILDKETGFYVNEKKRWTGSIQQASEYAMKHNYTSVQVYSKKFFSDDCEYEQIKNLTEYDV